MTIGLWLGEATRELRDVGIASAKLDAEIILAHTLRHPRTYLHAHHDEELDGRTEDIANARIDLRIDRVPVAYIVGHKEFYGRKFHVTTATLIPRPETEEMIQLLSEISSTTLPLHADQPLRLVDIGTGTGCLGITAKLEFPAYDVTLLDTSPQALTIAEKNARAHSASVTLLESNLLAAYPYSPDVVLANLPYVDKAWEQSPEVAHEPNAALYASKQGLDLIEKCFMQLENRMLPGASAIFEADPRQWSAIIKIAKAHGFKVAKQLRFATLFIKG
jgi:release factor glutamine methyltransferase